MEEHAALYSMLTGPTSSLILLLGMALGLWRFLTQTILPAAKGWVDQHLNQVDELLKQHEADRTAWLTSMQDCHQRATALNENIETVSRKVGGLYARHESLQSRLDAALTKPIDNGAA